MSHTCIRLENLNQEFLSDLHIYSHTNRVNILWDQHSPTSTHNTGLKQKMYVNLPSLSFSPMIPKYNGWASLVLLGKTQTNIKPKTKNPKPKPNLKMWSFITKEEKNAPCRVYSGTILPKSLSQARHPDTMLTEAIPQHQRKERVWCGKKEATETYPPDWAGTCT